MTLSDLEKSSPYTFTWKQKLQLWVIPPIVAGIARGIRALTSLEVRESRFFDDVLQSHGHVLVGLWHEVMPLAACHYAGSGFYSLGSYSFDGELAARTVRLLGVGVVRGSSSKGGHHALRQLEKAAKLVPAVGITIDGPRGPRRVAQPGIAILSARTGLPVVPNAFAVDSGWRLRSWDRFWIPKPFSRIVSIYGPPIPPPADESSEAVEAMRVRIEAELNRLHQQIETELGCVS